MFLMFGGRVNAFSTIRCLLGSMVNGEVPAILSIYILIS